MVRYLFAVMTDRTIEGRASPQEAHAIDAFNDRIESAGQRVMAVGIAAPDQARVFDHREGRQQVCDRPAIDSDLYMAGMWIIDAEDDTVAHHLAAEASKACNRLIEVRPLL